MGSCAPLTPPPLAVHPWGTSVHPWGTSGLAGSSARLRWVPRVQGRGWSQQPGGWAKGGGSAVTPQGEGSARRGSDSPWETERCRAGKRAWLWLSHPPRSTARRGKGQRPTGRCPACRQHPRPRRHRPSGTQLGWWHPGSSFPWALPAQPGPPAPHSRAGGFPFLKTQQNLLHFAFQKSLSLSKGNEGPAGWGENTRRSGGL